MQMHMLPIEQMVKEMGKEGDKEMGELMDYGKGGWVSQWDDWCSMKASSLSIRLLL